VDARKIVEKLGGSAEVARRLSVAKPTVYAWMQKGYIPEAMAWRILHVYGEAIVSKKALGLPSLRQEGAA
jgi:hypothetical protein